MTTPKTSTDSKQNLAPARQAVDWERIELDYRAGIKSLREIAEGSGTSHVNIAKRAKKLGWTRDLSAKIQSKADALVNAALVNTPVNNASPAAERETVEAAASTQASVRLAERADIQRSRSICMGLMAELEQQSVNPKLMAEVVAILRGTPAEEMTKEQRSKLAEAASKAASLSSRSSTMRSLSESLRILVGLERQAYGIKEELLPPADPGVATFSTADLFAMRDALKGGV
ncbi:hypothetical protein ACCQ08_23025 [Comamonas sp. SY3]|uniref:hypothetical protein n=1 Tax=Comamonas sp. SY3 TaxID=3243601 RepID=UPI003594872F